MTKNHQSHQRKDFLYAHGYFPLFTSLIPWNEKNNEQDCHYGLMDTRIRHGEWKVIVIEAPSRIELYKLK
nr:hypothetical protein [uncultured Allomuricauda sp.]